MHQPIHRLECSCRKTSKKRQRRAETQKKEHGQLSRYRVLDEDGYGALAPAVGGVMPALVDDLSEKSRRDLGAGLARGTCKSWPRRRRERCRGGSSSMMRLHRAWRNTSALGLQGGCSCESPPRGIDAMGKAYKNFTTMLPRTTLGTGLACTQEEEKEEEIHQ